QPVLLEPVLGAIDDGSAAEHGPPPRRRGETSLQRVAQPCTSQPSWRRLVEGQGLPANPRHAAYARVEQRLITEIPVTQPALVEGADAARPCARGNRNR